MERSASDASGAAWFLAAVQATEADQAADGQPPSDESWPNVIIAVSLDELDDMTGDMLV